MSHLERLVKVNDEFDRIADFDMDDVWAVVGRHAWDELRPLLDEGVIDAGRYSASEPCEVHFRVLSVHQSATLWDVTLFFADDALDADCSCPHGCVRWAARAG